MSIKPDPNLLQSAIDVIERWHNTCRRYDRGNASGADMSLARQDASRALQRAADAGHDVTELRELNDL